MAAYNHKNIEEKWQKKWEEEKLYATNTKSDKKKWYGLVEFPYPSGAGLHVGHVRSYTGLDIVARKRRSEGNEVLFPIGWDAFGLPAENYAIKTGIHPSITTKENIDTFRRQLKACGFSFDWDREVNTTDPSYYKWTQWIFLQMYLKGLAYKKQMPVNWCPKDKCVLANEEVVDGVCERCGTIAEKKNKEQWMLGITKYAERLDKDLDDTIYLDRIKIQQRNWIGMSEGSEIDFGIKAGDFLSTFTIFTTRADTLFGSTYCVFAPEHPMVRQLINEGKVENDEEVEVYINEAMQKVDMDRSAEGKEKTGMLLKGVSAIHPLTKKELPVYIADYVLPQYGTGAIMAVPAHDERDYAFAKKYGIEMVEVINQSLKVEDSTKIYTGEGVLFNSGDFDGLTSKEARVKITEAASGRIVKKSKLRDWVFARQRYWGEPIPLVYDTDGKMYPVHESELPIVLPQVDKFEPTDNGESPLYQVPDWVNVEGFINKSGYFISVPGFSSIAYNKEEPLDINDGDGGDAYKGGAPIIERNNVVCIIKHPTNDEYLIAKWKQVAWCGFVTGGIEEGATHEETAKAEIQEETGYQNIKKVSALNFASHGLFYHVVKKQNRFANYNLVVVELADLERTEVSKEEQAIADFIWVKKDEVEEMLTRFDMKSVWQFYTSGTFDAALSTRVITFRRETDTMPQWAGSSWYFMRYIDPSNATALGEKEMLAKWAPIDWYNGGMEHTTLHLLYSRFWYKFLFDIGLVPTNEPYYKRTSQGMILGEGGVKMSKSLGNVVNPDDIIREYGADTLRLYEMFIGPFDQAIAWNSQAVSGVRRFLDKVYSYKDKVVDGRETLSVTHQTLKKVTEDIETMSFNTCVSQMMIWANAVEKDETISKTDYMLFLQMLAPFAPHIAEELWENVRGEEDKTSIHQCSWPKYDPSKLITQEVVVAIQIAGKMRGTVTVKRDEADETLVSSVKNGDIYKKYVGDIEPKKVIIVKNKIVNIVI